MRDNDFKYPIIRSRRKTCAIKVKPDGSVIVCAPIGLPISFIQSFVDDHEDWIAKATKKIHEKANNRVATRQLDRDEIDYLAADAKRLLPSRVEYYADIIGVEYNCITIRTQRTRWGSCSSKGNLNFNCLLMLAPEDVQDYVVVHELCHLKEMNHSKRFWAEVERVLPDFDASYQWLKRHGNELMAQLPQK